MKRKSYLSELYDELMKCFPEHITIEQASKIAGVSKSKLKADFMREYGMPYYSWFRNERMKLAAKLLTETGLKIRDISEAAGYENSSKFSKAFFNVMGCSPSEYRRVSNTPVFSDTELADTNSVSLYKPKE